MSDEHEDMFRRSMAESVVGMALVAADGAVLEVNEALCRFFGHTPDTMTGKTWEELTHPDDRAMLGDLVLQVRRGHRDSFQISKRYLKSDGSVLEGRLGVSAIRHENGRLRHFVVQIMDVTEQARITEELRQSEEHFRLLAENASDVVVRASNDGVIEWVSPSVTAALGRQPQELVGVPFTDLVHVDDLDSVHEVQEGLGRGVRGRFETRLRDAQGGYHWFAVTVNPIRSTDGQLIGRVAAWRDIDREVESRQLAARREAEFRLLAENASDLVIRIGGHGRISWVSPSVQGTLGWDQSQIVGHDPWEFLDPGDHPRYARDLDRLRPGRVGRRTIRVRAADGGLHWFAVIATPLADADGTTAGSVLGLRSIDSEILALQALTDSEERFRTAMASAPGGMAVVGLDRRFIEVNEALAAMLRRDRDWLLDHGIADVLHPDDAPADLATRERVADGTAPTTAEECRLVRADGSLIWVQHAVGLVRDEEGAPLSYVSQFIDVTAARRAREELAFLAHHDPLTRLSNRRALVDAMTTLLHHPPRATTVGLLFLDLDGLKNVNDTFGHAAGDELLKTAAERISAGVRADDLVARLGGDEFVLVLPQVRSLDDVVAIGNKIRTELARPIRTSDHVLQVTCSAGATLAEPGEDPGAAIDRADRALYRAKATGRDRTVAFDAALDAEATGS